MNRIYGMGARVMAALGLAAAAGYLTWRMISSWSSVPMWLWIPGLAFEIVAFAGSGLLIWALWRKPLTPVVDRAAAVVVVGVVVDVVIRVGDNTPAEVRATILAASSMHSVGRLIVVDLSSRTEVAEVATELGAHYLAGDALDLNGLAAALGAVETPTFALLDAGDVPSKSLLDALLPPLDNPLVAIVQAVATAPAIDSPEHGANGVHELQFERTALNPALGQRGVAMWLGSGSLVRREALESVTIDNQRPLPAQWAISGALLTGGWRIESPAGPALISVQPLLTPEAVYDDRVRRARSARRLLIGRNGALGFNRLSLRQRAGLMAWTVRPLSGLARGVFIFVLVGSLLSGKLPLHLGSGAVLWVPAFFGATWAVAALSRGSLRLGDRTRWSLMTLGAAYRGLSSPPVLPSALPPLVSFKTVRHGAALVGAVVVVSTVMALRGVSDRLSHTLHPLSQAHLVGLMLVGLWLLALSLDAMRLLARRGRMRRAFRVVSSFPAQFGDRSAFVVDLTSLGAGLVSDHAMRVGDSAAFEMVLPTGSGCTTTMVAATVRNVSERPYGGWRIGIEFLAPAGATADALAEHCVIEPARRAMGEIGDEIAVVGRSLVDDVTASSAEEGRRALLRLAAAIAIVGATASVAPQPVDAAAPAQHLVRGSVVVAGHRPADGDPLPDSGLGGVVVMAVCSLAPGPDGEFGTFDDVFGPTTSTATDPDGTFDLTLEGAACWTSIPPPIGYAYEATVESSAVAPPDTVTGPVTAMPVTGPVEAVDLGAVVVTQQVVMVAVSTPAQPAGTDDVVWSDLDADGIHEIAEPGLAGVIVTMYDASGGVSQSTRTDADGHYRFASLAQGLYSVGVSSLPEGTTVGRSPVSAATGAQIDPVSSRTQLLSVVAGATSIGVDVAVAPTTSRTVQTAPHRVLPAPAKGMTAGASGRLSANDSTPLSLLVPLLGAGLAASLVLSYLVSRQRWNRQSASPGDLGGVGDVNGVNGVNGVSVAGGSSSLSPDFATR